MLSITLPSNRSFLRIALNALALFVILGFATNSAHAQTGGRSISRTYQADQNPSSNYCFHGADNPTEGQTGTVTGGADPTQPPYSYYLWVYSGGSLYVWDGTVWWRYTEWLGTSGGIYYYDKYGNSHYWGTWNKLKSYSAGEQADAPSGPLLDVPALRDFAAPKIAA